MTVLFLTLAVALTVVLVLRLCVTVTPLEPRLVADAFRPCSLDALSCRPLTDGDAELCLRVYRESQQAAVVPDGYEDEFLDWIDSAEVQKWVILSGSQLVACCGLTPHPGPSQFGLSFGLVDLGERSRGVGSLSLALRLWATRPKERRHVTMWATDHSVRYYKRFGFQEIPRSILPDGEDCPELYPLEIFLYPEDLRFLYRYLTDSFPGGYDLSTIRG